VPGPYASWLAALQSFVGKPNVQGNSRALGFVNQPLRVTIVTSTHMEFTYGAPPRAVTLPLNSILQFYERDGVVHLYLLGDGHPTPP
jgi:hypothetical protein